MDIWVGLGMGVIIGLLLGVLLAALVLQARLARAQRHSPEIARLQAEITTLNAEGARLQAEITRRQEETAKVRAEVRAEVDEHRLARTTLANEQTVLRSQYATVQSMLSSANKEKERLLLDMLTLRGEVDQLQRELAELKQQQS